MTSTTEYELRLSTAMEKELTSLSVILAVDKAEVIRRALSLFDAAVKADAVELTVGGQRIAVVVK